MRSRCRQNVPVTAEQLALSQRKGIGWLLAVRPSTCGAASALPPFTARPSRIAQAAEIRRMMAVPSLVAVERVPEVDVRVGDQAIVGALQAGEHAVDVMGDVDLGLAGLMVVARELDAGGVGDRRSIGLEREIDQVAVGIGGLALMR